MNLKKRKPGCLIFLLVVFILICVGFGISYLNKESSKTPNNSSNLVPTKEIKVRISLFNIYGVSLNNPSSQVASDAAGIRISLIPTEYTTPQLTYHIEVLAIKEGISLAKKDFGWERLPGPILPYPEITLEVGIPPSLREAYRMEASKPVAGRQAIKIENYLRITITRR